MEGYNIKYLTDVHQNKGLGSWRKLYLSFLQKQPFSQFKSIIEIGAGGPDFLVAAPQPRKVALDAEDRYRVDFESGGVEFHMRNIEQEDLEDLGFFDVVVCSDVFEHLLWPEVALKKIDKVMTERGVLFSHVPNEYKLKKTLSIMLGRSKGIYFHEGMEEWNDPHIRRFTEIGYRDFLKKRFPHNIPLAHLKNRKPARRLAALGIPVPFCMKEGPTFASTKDPELAAEIEALVAKR